MFNYKGDVSPAHNLRFSRPAGSLFLRYNVSKSVTFRAEVLGGLMTADDQYSRDPYQKQRGKAFRTVLFEGDLVSEYNFFNYEAGRHAVNWTPYVFGGAGYMGFRPSQQTGAYRRSGLTLPFGIGVKYEIRRPWSIGAEFGARKTFNDYLDDLGDNAAAGRFSQGDPGLPDMYAYLRLSVSYTFYRIVCPK